MPVFPSSYTSRTFSLVIRIAALCCKMVSSHSRGWVKGGGDGVVVPAAVAFLKPTVLETLRDVPWLLLGTLGYVLTLTCSLFFFF